MGQRQGPLAKGQGHGILGFASSLVVLVVSGRTSCGGGGGAVPQAVHVPPIRLLHRLEAGRVLAPEVVGCVAVLLRCRGARA